MARAFPRRGRRADERLALILAELPDAMSLPEVLGYLTASGSAPTLVKPTDWIHDVLGGSDLESEEQARAVIDGLVRVYNRILHDLDHGRAPIPASRDERELAVWCRGYLKAARADPVWTDDNAAVLQLYPFCAVAGELDFDPDDDLDDPESEADGSEKFPRDESLRLLPQAVLTLHSYLEDERTLDASEGFEDEVERVPRNAPCPGGSGKKFKRCCGAA